MGAVFEIRKQLLNAMHRGEQYVLMDYHATESKNFGVYAKGFAKIIAL